MADILKPVEQTQEDTKFINKLYDDSLSRQKDALAGNYTQNVGALDTEQQRTQNQTQGYLQRTDVEAEKGRQNAPISGLSAGAQQQAALTLDNQQKRDTAALQDAQSQADAEIQRQRQLLASEYEAAIKQAQADNDMVRAQQLYEAAKREEERLRGYQRDAGDALAAKGDYSIVKNLYGLSDDQMSALNAMYTPTAAPEGYTIPENLKEEAAALQRIYDASMESANQKLQTEYDRNLSDLQAKQQTQQRKTDQALTDAYVDALKKGKNYNEVQTSYGMGSGTKAQAAIAREAGLQGDLTDLRRLQLDTDAQYGQNAAALLRDMLSGRQNALAEAQASYNKDLNTAYTNDKEQQLSDQQAAGELLAKKKNDYSILGELWGLSKDQIDRLQSTGKYAPQGSGFWPAKRKAGDNGSGGGGTGNADIDLHLLLNSAVAHGGGQKEVNQIIDAAQKDGMISSNVASDTKSSYNVKKAAQKYQNVGKN